MTRTSNGCIELRYSHLAAIVSVLAILSIVGGAAFAWATLAGDVAQLKADDPPTRAEYDATLKGLERSLSSIDSRLARLESRRTALKPEE